VVSFAPLPLYPRGNSPRYPLDRRLSTGRIINVDELEIMWKIADMALDRHSPGGTEKNHENDYSR
jgi:hypothetical protein